MKVSSFLFLEVTNKRHLPSLTMRERERERDNFVCTHARFAGVGYEPRGSFIYLGHILVYKARVFSITLW